MFENVSRHVLKIMVFIIIINVGTAQTQVSSYITTASISSLNLISLPPLQFRSDYFITVWTAEILWNLAFFSSSLGHFHTIYMALTRLLDLVRHEDMVHSLAKLFIDQATRGLYDIKKGKTACSNLCMLPANTAQHWHAFVRETDHMKWVSYFVEVCWQMWLIVTTPHCNFDILKYDEICFTEAIDIMIPLLLALTQHPNTPLYRGSSHCSTNSLN